MLDGLRSTLYRALASSHLPMRLNAFLGKPLAPAEELAKRREAHARLAALRLRGETTPASKATRAPAPVMVYFEKDRNVRELERTKETLEARGIEFQLLDVTGDEAALAFVMRAASCAQDELPIVFVAGEALGGFRKLVEADVSGLLAERVWGAAQRV